MYERVSQNSGFGPPPDTYGTAEKLTLSESETQSAPECRGGGLFGIGGLFQGIGAEELLLIALIILLVMESADLDLILVLAFLLLAGM